MAVLESLYNFLCCYVFVNCTSTILVTVSLFFCVIYLYDYLTYRNWPPKCDDVPILGSIPGVTEGSFTSEYASKLSKKLNSKIVMLRVLGLPLVVLNDYELIKDCFVRRGDIIDRPRIFMFKLADPDYVGVVFSSGRIWKEQRRFSLRIMRDFGMGKIGAEDNICHESAKAIEAFKAEDGQAFDPKLIVNMAVSNVINYMVFGKRFEYTDEKFRQCLAATNEFMHLVSKPTAIVLIFKLGRFFMKETHCKVVKSFEIFANFIREQIEEHKTRYDGSVNDLIDAHLQEAETTEDKDIFNDKQLQYLICDMFFAGSETTFTSLRWALLYMAAHPQIQKRVQNELDDEIGSRLPNMNDKRNTPYTVAVLSEIQRMNTLAPLGVGHCTVNEEIEISGYKIPKQTAVIANLEWVHRDPEFWKDPDNFNPENFLDKEGNVVNLERLIPFSIGRRSCAGEALARMELYVFFSSWMKDFEIKLETDSAVPDLEPIVETGIKHPKPFSIRMIPRR